MLDHNLFQLRIISGRKHLTENFVNSGMLQRRHLSFRRMSKDAMSTWSALLLERNYPDTSNYFIEKVFVYDKCHQCVKLQTEISCYNIQSVLWLLSGNRTTFSSGQARLHVIV